MTDLSVNIDFIILNSLDPYVIAVADRSRWGVAEELPAYILITPPGSTRAISTVFQKERINFFHSVNLGQTCVVDGCGGQNYEKLDDGVWEFCLKSGYDGLEKKRYLLKDDNLRIELDKLFISQNLRYNPESQIFKDTKKITFFLDSAQAYLRDGDISMAKLAFNSAQKETEKYLKCQHTT